MATVRLSSAPGVEPIVHRVTDGTVPKEKWGGGYLSHSLLTCISHESAGCRFAVIGSVGMPTCCVIDQRTDDRVSAGQKLMLWVGASWRAWQ